MSLETRDGLGLTRLPNRLHSLTHADTDRQRLQLFVHLCEPKKKSIVNDPKVPIVDATAENASNRVLAD